MKQTIQLSPVNGGYGDLTPSKLPGRNVQLTPIGNTDSQAFKMNSRTSSASMGIIPRVNSFQIQMSLPDLSDWRSTIEDIAGAKIIQIINLDSESLITDVILDSSTSSQSVMLQLNFNARINVDDIKYQIQNKWSKLNIVMQIAEPKDGKSVTDEDTAFNSQARFLSNKILKKLDILMSNVNPIQNTMVSPKPTPPAKCGINPYIMTAEERVSCARPIIGKLIKIQAPSQEELMNIIPMLESTLNSKIDAIVIYGEQIYPSKDSFIVGNQSGGGDVYEVYFTTPSVTEMAVANILTNTKMSVISSTGAAVISELSVTNTTPTQERVTPIIKIGKCGIDPSLMSQEQKDECNVVTTDDIVTPVKVEAPSLGVLLNNIEDLETSLNTTIVAVMFNGEQVYPILTNDPSLVMTGGGNDIYEIYFDDTTITEDDVNFIIKNNIDMQNDGIHVIMSTTPQGSTTTPQGSTTRQSSTTTPPQGSTTTPQAIDLGICGIDPSLMSQEQKDECNVVSTDDIVAPVKLQAPSLDAILNNIEALETSLNTTIVCIMLNGEQVYPILTDDPSLLMTGGGNDIYEIYFDNTTIKGDDVEFIIENNTDIQAAGITVIISTTPQGSTTTPQGSTTTPPQGSTTTPPQISTTPQGSTTTPQGSTTTPQGSTTTPQGSTTTPPQGSTTTPPQISTTPQGSTTTPQGSTTTPQGSTTTPQGSTTTPQGSTTTPPQSSTTTTPQSSTTTTPQGSTTTTPPQSSTTTPPQSSTTTPQGSTTTPQGSTTTPAQGSTTTTPQGSTTTTTPQGSTTTTTPQGSTTTTPAQGSTTTPQGSTTTPLSGGYRRTKRAIKGHRRGTYRYYRKHA